MQVSRFSFTCIVLLTAALILSGCTSQEKYDDLKLRNRSQQQRIDDLEGQLNVTKLKLAQIEKQLAEAQAACAADTDALTKKVEALQSDIANKEELIKKMQAALGGAVPAGAAHSGGGTHVSRLLATDLGAALLLPAPAWAGAPAHHGGGSAGCCAPGHRAGAV